MNYKFPLCLRAKTLNKQTWIHVETVRSLRLDVKLKLWTNVWSSKSQKSVLFDSGIIYFRFVFWLLLIFKNQYAHNEGMSCSKQWLYERVTSQLVETVAYVFTDIPFFDRHSPFFLIKNGLSCSSKEHSKWYLNV